MQDTRDVYTVANVEYWMYSLPDPWSNMNEASNNFLLSDFSKLWQYHVLCGLLIAIDSHVSQPLF